MKFAQVFNSRYFNSSDRLKQEFITAPIYLYSFMPALEAEGEIKDTTVLITKDIISVESPDFYIPSITLYITSSFPETKGELQNSTAIIRVKKNELIPSSSLELNTGLVYIAPYSLDKYLSKILDTAFINILKTPLHGETVKELTSADVAVNAQSKNVIATIDINGYTIILFSYPMYLNWSDIIRAGTKIKSTTKNIEQMISAIRENYTLKSNSKNIEQVASLTKGSYSSKSIINNEEKRESIIETTE